MKQETLQQFWEDCKRGVYNFTDNGKCTCCGECCTALLPMTKKELKTIQRYVKKRHIRIEKHDGCDLDLICPFRDNGRKICTVYEVRPTICRDFKCNKPQKKIDDTKERFSYDGRFRAYNLREIFK